MKEKHSRWGGWGKYEDMEEREKSSGQRKDAIREAVSLLMHIILHQCLSLDFLSDHLQIKRDPSGCSCRSRWLDIVLVFDVGIWREACLTEVRFYLSVCSSPRPGAGTTATPTSLWPAWSPRAGLGTCGGQRRRPVDHTDRRYRLSIIWMWFFEAESEMFGLADSWFESGK